MEINARNIKLWSMLGMRGAFGSVLTEIAKNDTHIVALTADFTKSTNLTKFKELFPNRFLSVGIAEQNMIGLASGLSSEGERNVFACSFASFISSRCYEQVRINLGYMRNNVKLVGIAAGLGVSYQGNTHYSLEDVSIMRAIPNMIVIVPSDCTEVAKATVELCKHSGPAYLRLVGEGLIPIVNKDDYKFEIGKGIILKGGKDICIFANGTMLNQAIKVANRLAEKGVDAEVINMHTVKPLDKGLIKSEVLGKKLIISMEEGSVIGGLGSAVAEYVATQEDMPRMLILGINDIFPHAGSYDYLLKQCGLDEESIVGKILINLQ